MAKIVNVELVTRKNEDMLAVTYETGTVRYYSQHIPPETVKEFLGGRGEWVNRIKKMQEDGKAVEAATDPEPVREPEPIREPEPEYRAVEIVLKSIVKDPEYFDTPIPPRKELPERKEQLDPEPAVEIRVMDPPAILPEPARRGPSASEAVMLGLCIGFAVAWWGIVGIVQILAAGIDVLWSLAWPRVKAGCRIAAAGAKALAASLPEVTTRRGLAVAVRVLPIMVGLMMMLM